MKQLSWKLILPLTIISFFAVTKWWYVLVIDGVDVLMSGFPLPYACPCFHTSVCSQIFVLNLIIDICCYFFFWFSLIFIFNRFIKPIKVPKGLTIVLISLSGLILSGMLFAGIFLDNVYKFENDFDYEVIDTGIEFWQTKKRPELNEYPYL